jgi:outer membrane protein OmpA-like peptidoglycan-associated protein
MKKITLLLSLAVVTLFILLSGCGGTSLAKADEAKKRMNYKIAGDLYTQAVTNIKDKDEAQRGRMEAAFCYRMANEYEKAIKAYEKVLRKEPKNTEALFQLGSLNMKISGDGCNPDATRKAREWFTKYLEEVPNDDKVVKRVAGIDSAENWRKDIPLSRYKVSNFKIANTKGMDYSPMIASKKDDVLYFSTDREGGVAKKKIYGQTGNGYSDMWYLKSKKGKKTGEKTWDKPVIALGTINTKFNDGSSTFDRKYSTIYYTQCNGPDGKSTSCKLFSAKMNGTEWGEEQMLSFCINDSFDYGHPAMSDDGKTLYFSSNREGGEGGYDIWCSVYNQRAKDWGEPFNLGNTVNTESDEMFPYWNLHEQVLYYSSNGHLGMGGLDIFKVEGSGTEWTEPENLRAPLNSGGDDFGMTFDNNNRDHGFFTSNRCGGRGNFDIYEFNITPLVIELEGYVYECVLPKTNPATFNNSKPLANSILTITNDKDTSKIIVKTDANGYYGKIRLNEKTNYEISCTNRELYYFDADLVQRTTKGIKLSTTLKQDFCLYSQIIEEVVPIYYDLDKANIRPDAAKELDERILPLLVKYPKLRLELGSHTDCRSSYAYNEDLSQRRADSAVAYLVRKGIDARRLLAKGYGESQLVNDCKCEGAVKVPCTEDQHQENRRTTIRTLDVNFDPKVAAVNSTDANNTNVKAIIVKLRKSESNLLASAAGNDIVATGQALVAPGADIIISVLELKNLIAKGVVKQADLTGVTLAEIASGRIKPTASVKLNTLRIGTKERGYTFMSPTLKIAGMNNPYSFGIDAIKASNGTVNTEEGEITFKNVNTEALKDGPIDSKLTTDKKDDKTTPTPTTPAVSDTLALDAYNRINLTPNGEVPTMVNNIDNVNWVYKADGRKIEVTEEKVKELLDNKVISKKDFEDGESIKLADGTKLPSSVFVATIQIGDAVLENVKISVSSKATESTMGGLNTQLKKINAFVKNGVLFFKVKEKKEKPSKD